MALQQPKSPAEPVQQVPFFRPDIGEAEIAAVVDTIRSGWLTVGPKTQAFERAFAGALGAEHAIAVSSCTAALHLALDALDLEPDDEVITSTLTFTATGASILHAGAKPVLADCTADTLNLDPRDVARKITRRTKAIVPVHFAGHPVAMDEILSLASQHGLKVIEDAAHALPAKYRGRAIGTISDMTAFSFYATKNLTTGEGGMLTTADADLAARLQSRRLHGMSRDAWNRYSGAGSWRYDVSYPGFKYNMTDTAAAMGLVQLERLPSLAAKRRYLAEAYTRGLSDVEGLQLPVELPEVESGWHLYVIRLRPEQLTIDRDTMIERLKERGVGTSVHFIPLHLHSYYRDALQLKPEDLPVASAAAETILSLPFFTLMTDAEVDYVLDVVRDLIRRNRR